MPLPLPFVPSADSLNALVGDAIGEDLQLEYKRDMYGGSDAESRELLKDVSSIANAAGGALLIGIEESGDGQPIAIPGIEPGAHPERIEQACRQGITPPIPGLVVTPIALESGREVILVSIPESAVGPHMVGREEHRFWIRHGRTKTVMTQREVVEHVLRIRSIVESIDVRWESLRSRAGQVFHGTAHIIAAAYPVPLGSAFDIDSPEVRSGMMLNRGWAHPDYPARTYLGAPYPSLRGVRAEEAASPDWFELSRDGALEFAGVCTRIDAGTIDCHDWLLVTYPLVLVSYDLGSRLGLSQNLVYRTEVSGIAGKRLQMPFARGGSAQVEWHEDALDFGEFGAGRGSTDPYAVGHELADRLARVFRETAGLRLTPSR